MNSKKYFKVILIGQCSVGKSSIIYRLCNKKFGGIIDPTIGCAFNRKYLEINDKTVALNCWDTAGQERFKSIVPMYFKDADGIVITFDVTNANSFQELEKYWLPLIIEYYDDHELPKIVFAANKMDLVPDNDIVQINKRIDADVIKLSTLYDIDIMCFKTSAFSGINVNKMFEKLASKLIDEIGYEVDEDDFFIKTTLDNDSESYYSCCWGGTPVIDDNAIIIN